MEATHIATKSGKEFDHLFPKPKGQVIIINRHAKLEDTIKFLPKGIKQSLNETQLIAPELKLETPYDTCKNIWDFAFDHISYRRDELYKEQIQSPAVTWALRAGDCDDYTVIIVSILLNLNYQVVLRIAMYTTENGFQHIYPVAILPDGSEVIMDCVAKKFNYEVPFIKKIDKNMELQFLNGLPDTRTSRINQNIDADDLLEGYDGDDVGDLGKGKLKAKIKAVVKKVQNTKVAQTIRKGLHVANRLNPAAALLREGILIALKTNLFQIAERLRFSYLTPQQVNERNLDMDKYNRLIGIRDQLEKIFFRAGGKIENFKKAMLTGKGNRDKQVPLSGLGAIDFNEYTNAHSARQILGIETYDSELNGVEGFGDLGEPISAGAAVTAATAALTAIAALLKSIGGLKKQQPAAREAATETESANETTPVDTTSTETTSPITTGDETFTDSPTNEKPTVNKPKSNRAGADNVRSNAETSAATNTAEGSTKSVTEETNDSSGQSENTSTTGEENVNENTQREAEKNTTPVTTAKEKEGFLTKAGNWIKANPVPATIGGLLIAGTITFVLVKTFKKPKEEKGKHKESLAGLPHRKKSKQFNSSKIKTYKLR